MERESIQNKHIEKLANLGYWEWHPKEMKTLLSEGFKNIFQFIDCNVTPSHIVKYLKRTSQDNEHLKLLKYLRKVKNGSFPGIVTFEIRMENNIYRYFELNSFNTSNSESHRYIAGIVQEVTERIKYNTLKEKEIVFEKTISEIATKFVSNADFEGTIEKTLSKIGVLCEAGRVCLLKIENNTISYEFEWKQNSITNKCFTNELPPQEIKFLIELIKEKKLIFFHSVNEFPEIAKEIKATLVKNSVNSIIFSAIQKDKQTIGALLIIRYKNPNKWDFSDIHIAKMTSLILSNAIRQQIIQKELKKSENRLQFALLAGNLGTWELNLQKQQFYYDERFANTVGYSNNTLNKIPSWFKNNIHPDDINHYYDALDECLEGNRKYFSLEYRLKCKNGQYKWINDWGIVTNISKDGEPIKMVGIIQDISKRKSAEIDLIKAKEMAEENEKLKTAFLANVSHEIRTPMNGINGFAELLYNNMVSDDDKHQYLEIIWKNSNRLLLLINNILDISKIETKQISIFEREYSLNDILKEVEAKFEKDKEAKKSIQFRIINNLDKNASFVNIDDSRVKQILINLISNSYKFTSIGHIEVSCGINEKGKLEFYVKDTGSGIAKEYQKHLFERFSPTQQAIDLNKGGSGLGLPISKGLVELMGGSIWFKSLRGVGTTFHFYIPFKPTRLKIEKLD
ncbi:MAG: PAS domain-containing protein [Salinivirgaceae bacterium]|nr:PAS domain-containing protein [Salinivirgaceae bacterium]